jgi:5-methylcytosine-specific restriction protein A
MANKPKKVNRSWVPERKPFEREQDNSDFYNSRTWRKLRKFVLDKNPLCVNCERNGIISVAKVGDHIVPINKGGERLKESNIQGLCKKCHDSKSGRESGK